MKSSEEMLDSLFERRNKYIARKKARMKTLARAASVVSCFCIAVLVGIGVRNSVIRDPSENIDTPTEPTPPISDTVKTDPITTESDTTSDTTADTTTADTSTDDTTEHTEPVCQFPLPMPEPYDGPPVGGGSPNAMSYRYYMYVSDLDSYALGKAFSLERAEQIKYAFYDLYAIADKNKNEGMIGTGWLRHGSTKYLNCLWQVIRMTDMTREEVELYNSYIEDHPFIEGNPYFAAFGRKLTEEQIDALFYEDEWEARRALKSPYALFSEADGEIYVYDQLACLSKDEFKALDFPVEDVIEFVETMEALGANWSTIEFFDEEGFCAYIREIADLPAKPITE